MQLGRWEALSLPMAADRDEETKTGGSPWVTRDLTALLKGK